MATFTGETDTAFAKLVYTAIPLDVPIFRALEGHRTKNRLHRWNSDEEDVQAVWGFLNEDPLLTFSLSRFEKEVKQSFQYDEPTIWPPNHTSLQVGATGSSQEAVETLIDELLGRWDCVELHMKDEYRPHYMHGVKAFLTQYQLDSQIIRKYNEARAKLPGAVELPHATLPDSSYIKNQMMTYPTFYRQPALPASVQMTLIDRVKCEVEGRGVELSLVYLNGNNMLGTYGVLAFTTGHKHPILSKEVRSCAGYLFGTDYLHVGGVAHIREANTVLQITDHILTKDYKEDSVAKSKVKGVDVPEMKMLAELFIS